ncbi:InlB B-repeat-containing protein [Parabacteroides sp. APC149_11_2_Y6]
MRKLISLMLLMMVIVVGCKKDDVIMEYIVSFDSQGGSGLSPVKVPEGSKVTKPGDPIKEGETFLGWYKEQAYTTIWDFDRDIVNQNLTLYARWSKPGEKVYTVTFESNGGTTIEPVPVVEEEKVIKPSNPTKEGYSFLGWYVDPECTEAWFFYKDVVKEDLTLYARWSKSGETVYTVTFESNGGSEVEESFVVEKEKIIKPADPTKDGYNFLGWYVDPECTEAWQFYTYVVTENVTLYARWASSAEKVYTVTFDSKGGSEIDEAKVVEGEKLTKPSDPTRDGYSFLGWYVDPEYTEPWLFSVNEVKADMTLYARWSNPGQMIYTVSYDTDGGSVIESSSVLENEKLIKPAEPKKVGYEFSGWYTTPDKTTKYDFDQPVTQDMTLYAKWAVAKLELSDFVPGSDFVSNKIKWDEASRTIDISNATAGSVLRFNISGVRAVEYDVVHAYDTRAASIGGRMSLRNIVSVGSLIDGEIAMKINVPAQSIKVPIDVTITIKNFDKDNESEIITIKSRPNYANTTIQPVLMKTTDDKYVFWAPVNAEATKIPESLADAADRNNPKSITESCGKLFQWGRKFGFAATNDATKTSNEKFDGKTDPLGFPKGQGALAEMSEWDGKFITFSYSAPNSQGNWLFFYGDGSDNPANEKMTDLNVWYQQLWNKGTEYAPVKTEYDPCPAGWRVPTMTEWKAIGVGNTAVTKEWDGTKKLLSIAGAESGQKLILPAAGVRDGDSGDSGGQGGDGFYWSSSVPLGNAGASVVFFLSAAMEPTTNSRANGHSIRCIQE